MNNYKEKEDQNNLNERLFKNLKFKYNTKEKLCLKRIQEKSYEPNSNELILRIKNN